jgi:hypothetical protein
MHSFTWALDGGEWSASRPHCFTPRERTPGIHWIGVWVGPRTGLVVVWKKKKFPSPAENRTLINRSFFPKIHSNITLTSTSRYSELFQPFTFSD